MLKAFFFFSNIGTVMMNTFIYIKSLTVQVHSSSGADGAKGVYPLCSSSAARRVAQGHFETFARSVNFFAPHIQRNKVKEHLQLQPSATVDQEQFVI